jgi:FAS-associated factor 2
MVWPFGATAPPVRASDAAHRFNESFEQRYGPTPPFVRGSYREAKELARAQNRFLLVYLHSPLHQDSDRFCRDTLAAREVRDYLDENFSAWAGSIEFAEPYNLSNEHIRPAAYPFLAVLLCKPDNSEACLDRIEGTLSPAALVRRLGDVQAQHAATLARVARAQQQRSDSISLRSEQDSEYMQAAEADRQREAAAREAARRREEEAEAAEAAQELAAALEMSVTLNDEAVLARKRGRLAPEPPAGPDATKLRLQLPSGKKLDRRFAAEATLQEVRDFVDVALVDNGLDIKTYSLSTNMPRKTYNEDGATLRVAGLHPQSVLFVQDLDA